MTGDDATMNVFIWIPVFPSLRAATNESQKTRNKKQETKRFSTFTVSRLRHSETKKTLLDSRIKFLAKHV